MRKRNAEVFAAIRDELLVVIGKCGPYLVTIVAIPLIARSLGPDGLGVVAIAMAGFFLGSVLVDLGITQFIAVHVNKDSLIGGVGEKVIDGVTGALADMRDKSSVAQAVHRALGCDSANARQHVTECSTDVFKGKIVEWAGYERFRQSGMEPIYEIA